MMKAECPACGAKFWEPDIREYCAKAEWYRFQHLEVYCPSCKTKLRRKNTTRILSVICCTGLLIFHVFSDTPLSRYLLACGLLLWVHMVLFRKYEKY